MGPPEAAMVARLRPAILLFAISLAPAASAQTPAPSPSGFSFTASRGFVVTRDVVGQDVTSRDNPGRILGRLVSLVLTAPGGQAQYAVIDVGGLLGIGAKPVVVPFALLHFDGQYDRPALALAEGRLAGAPDAPDDRLAALLADQAWRKGVEAYFAPDLAAAAPVPFRPPPHGWFTVEQAARGRTTFESNCATCHGADLSGGAGPALSGAGFLERWRGRTLADLDSFEHTQMPLNAPGSLSPEQYADITSFILQRNGFSAGSAAPTGSERRLLRP